jgi:hypothetical protein
LYQSAEVPRHLDLNGRWQVSEAGKNSWIPANFPGRVHKGPLPYPIEEKPLLWGSANEANDGKLFSPSCSKFFAEENWKTTARVREKFLS